MLDSSGGLAETTSSPTPNGEETPYRDLTHNYEGLR